MADDFDGCTILSESEADSFFNPGAGDRRDDGALDAEVREAVYLEEIAEIDRLREYLKLPHPGRYDMTAKAREKGNQILDRRQELAEARFHGESIPEPKVTKTTGSQTAEIT